MNLEERFPDVQIKEPVNFSNVDEGKIDIGKGTGIQPFVSILSKESITIGEGCSIASGVCIVDHDHYIGEKFQLTNNSGKVFSTTIGNNCWIGANAVILKGVTLGEGCVVGAGSVVTKSFPPGSILFGNPAKYIKIRQ